MAKDSEALAYHGAVLRETARGVNLRRADFLDRLDRFWRLVDLVLLTLAPLAVFPCFFHVPG
jgi:hypothetical protein